jgi:hypothetical protein
MSGKRFSGQGRIKDCHRFISDKNLSSDANRTCPDPGVIPRPVFSLPMCLACTSFKEAGNIFAKILTTFLYGSMG